MQNLTVTPESHGYGLWAAKESMEEQFTALPGQSPTLAYSTHIVLNSFNDQVVVTEGTFSLAALDLPVGLPVISEANGREPDAMIVSRKDGTLVKP